MTESIPLLPKNKFVAAAMQALIDRYFVSHGYHAQLGELTTFASDFLDGDGAALLALIDGARRDKLVSRLVREGRYPNFFADVERALKECQLPASRRSPRTYT